MFAAQPRVDWSIACFSEQGFIDVGFLCPGGQYKAPDGTTWQSGGAGPPDQAHWQNCVEPLADVLSFATGKKRSLEGKSIRDYSGSIRPMTKNAGVVGWSLGGNLAVLAMARYGERFSGLRWYASWESPILGPFDDGRGTNLELNPFYDAETDTIEFARLRYSPEMPLWVWPILALQPKSDWPHGGLYLDGDNNGRFNKDADFGFWVDVELGPPLKTFYSPLVTKEAHDRKVFGDHWPAHIATVEEVEQRQSSIDAVRHTPLAARKLRHLAVLVFESHKDHVGGLGGYSHANAVTQVNGWIDARARWVRFNPDAHYLRMAMGKEPSREIQYPAGRKIDLKVIRELVEPEADEGGPTDAQGMSAVVGELADRTHANNWAPVLTQVLIQSKSVSAPAR
jgi:hypothetical protein